MRELVPCPGEGVGELFRVLVVAPRDQLVVRVRPEREIGRKHHRGMALRRVMGIRHGVVRRPVGGTPLIGARRALGELPLVAKQVLEETVVPLGGVGRPDDLQPAGDRVVTVARAERVLPPQTLFFYRGTFGFATHVLRGISGTVGLAESVPAGNEGHRLLIVHGHARERLPDVQGGGDGSGLPFGPSGFT